MTALTYKQPTVVSYPPRVAQATNHLFMIIIVALMVAIAAVAVLSLPTVESWQQQNSHHQMKSSHPVRLRSDAADIAFNGWM
jgi:flagellar basal body-associated protein FliL